MEKDWLDDTATIVGIVASILTVGLIPLFKFGRKKITEHMTQRQIRKSSYDAVIKIAPELEKIVKVLPKIIEMSYQFSDNGGTNIKGLLDDIKNNQKLIMQSTRIYQNMQGLSYWESDEFGKCCYASKAMCKMVDKSQEDILSNNWASWVKHEVFEHWYYTIKHNLIFEMEYSWKVKENEREIEVVGYAEHKFIDGKYCGSLGHLKLKQK